MHKHITRIIVAIIAIGILGITAHAQIARPSRPAVSAPAPVAPAASVAPAPTTTAPAPAATAPTPDATAPKAEAPKTDELPAELAAAAATASTTQQIVNALKARDLRLKIDLDQKLSDNSDITVGEALAAVVNATYRLNELNATKQSAVKKAEEAYSVNGWVILVGFLVLALGGIGYYFWSKRNRNQPVGEGRRGRGILGMFLIGTIGLGLLGTANIASAQTKSVKVVSLSPDGVGQDYQTPDKEAQKIVLSAAVKGDVTVTFSNADDTTNANVSGITFTGAPKGNTLEGKLTVAQNVPVGTYKVWVNDNDGNDLASGGELFVFSPDLQLLGYYLQQKQTGVNGQIATLRKLIDANNATLKSVAPQIEATNAKIALVDGKADAVNTAVTTLSQQTAALSNQVRESLATISANIDVIRGDEAQDRGEIQRSQADVAAIKKVAIKTKTFGGRTTIGEAMEALSVGERTRIALGEPKDDK